MKIGVIITPERKRDKIIKAFDETDLNYEFINLLADDWEKLLNNYYDGFLIYPPAFPDEWKSIFIKRLILLKNVLKGKSLPDIESIIMYESKLTMHDYLKINKLPHIESHTFYNYLEAIEFSENCTLPIVLKEDGGSGAIGVKIIKNRKKLRREIKKSFFLSNKVRKYNRFKYIKSSLINNIYPYKIFVDSGKQYLPKNNKKTGVIHLQSYLKVKNEWRIIRIGDSFFGHKKLEDEDGFHSGSLSKGWGHVNIDLLNLVKKWSDDLKLECMCFDIFEDTEGNYFINELQVIFGTSTEAQLMINGKSGRYVFRNDWIFEEGNFSKNGCNNLRIELLIQKLGRKLC